MKRPSFQFYPADWKNNSKLRRCSEAARGAWADILCLLHDFDEYGVCRWPLAELARAAGVNIKLAKELVAKDVLKGADKGAADYVFTPTHAGKSGKPVTLVTAGDGPCWYCSRFVRDEYVRQRRGQSSRFTSENQPGSVEGSDDHPEPPKNGPKDQPKSQPKGGIGERQGDGPTSTSSSTTKANTPQTPQGGLSVVAKPERKTKDRGTTLKTFLEDCKANGIRPIREYRPVWEYAETAKLPEYYVSLAWVEFARRFGAGGVKEANLQKDWRKTFRNYVENNYLKLWAIDANGEYFLTTQGKQAQTVAEAA